MANLFGTECRLTELVPSMHAQGAPLWSRAHLCPAHMSKTLGMGTGLRVLELSVSSALKNISSSEQSSLSTLLPSAHA